MTHKVSIICSSKTSECSVQFLFADVSQLQNFVNIAMATTTIADDVVCDKLSTLRTVGSAFGSLIYNLPVKEGYQTLCERCKLLWKALDNNKSLPKLLVRLF